MGHSQVLNTAVCLSVSFVKLGSDIGVRDWNHVQMRFYVLARDPEPKALDCSAMVTTQAQITAQKQMQPGGPTLRSVGNYGTTSLTTI